MFLSVRKQRNRTEGIALSARGSRVDTLIVKTRRNTVRVGNVSKRIRYYRPLRSPSDNTRRYVKFAKALW